MKKVLLAGLFLLGFMLLIAEPDESQTTGVFIAELVLTKAGAFACFAGVMKVFRGMEDAGEFNVEDE